MTDITEIKYQLFGETFKFKTISIIDGCFVDTWNNTIDIWDDQLKNKIEKNMPLLVNDGINNASLGVIQDPAGSAIGAPYLCGGGASGAIYNMFSSLENIPRIAKCSAIFNTTSDPDGQRVVHTHSPVLHGDPENEEDCMQVTRMLANAYLNAMIAFGQRRDKLGKHGALLNLVPISASIFGGKFKRGDLNHIDPSITLVSIALAIGVLIHNNLSVPKMCLYFYERNVHVRAQEYMNHTFISKK